MSDRRHISAAGRPDVPDSPQVGAAQAGEGLDQGCHVVHIGGVQRESQVRHSGLALLTRGLQLDVLAKLKRWY